MVTHDEKQNPLRDVRSGLVWSHAEILKCVGCLLVLMGMAVVAISIDTQPEAHGSAQAERGAVHDQQGAALAASRNDTESAGHGNTIR